jgi:ATP-dependent exoDNAse (exonuclease V) beta subunit
MDTESLRDEAEGVRLAYVAATRARDLLVVPAVGDAPADGWTEPLSIAMYPHPLRGRLSRPAPGCPSFGEDSVLERPPEIVTRPRDSVRPGLHRMSADVVWWDPAVLRLGLRQDFGLAQEELLSSSGHAEASLRDYQEWKMRRAEAIAAGIRPRFELLTASSALESPPGPKQVVEIEAIEKDLDRPGGRRFGSLVHAVLRDIPLGDPSAILSVIAAQSLRHGTTDLENAAAEAVLRRALDHPLIARARSADRCLREMPIHLDLGGGRIFEGIVDLAFMEGGQWGVVDFKTDVELPVERYRRQLEWYLYALSTITGKGARGWLLTL